MTRIPFTEQHEIIGLAHLSQAAVLGPYCARPGCNHTGDERHHIVRRSFLGGDYSFVEYKGQIIQNVVGLCHEHHDQVTRNVCSISWNEADRAFDWYEGSFRIAPLCSLDDDPRYAKADSFVGPASGEKCPTCKRKVPQPKEEHEETRIRRTWAITVPKDERENGAEVLDTLMNECREFFGHDESKRVRYFTLVQALSLIVQNQEKMVADD